MIQNLMVESFKKLSIEGKLKWLLFFRGSNRKNKLLQHLINNDTEHLPCLGGIFYIYISAIMCGCLLYI